MRDELWREEVDHDEPRHDYDNVCESVGCENQIHISDHYCEDCAEHRCSVCGESIGLNSFPVGRTHMCRTCRDATVAICTCVSNFGETITYDESALRHECEFVAAYDNVSVWKCSCCGQNMFVSHDRDGKIISLHTREVELNRMAALYGGLG